METQVQSPEFVESNSSEIVSPEGMTSEASSSLATASSSSTDLQPDEQWQQVGSRVRLFLSQLPDNISRFYQNNQQPIIALGLLLATFIGLRVLLAILGALNGIPLLAPILELVGGGYIVWFINRYLLKASSRQELTRDIQSFKRDVLGGYQVPES